MGADRNYELNQISQPESPRYGLWSPPWWPYYFRFQTAVQMGVANGLGTYTVYNYLSRGEYKLAAITAIAVIGVNGFGLNEIKQSLQTSQPTIQTETPQHPHL